VVNWKFLEQPLFYIGGHYVSFLGLIAFVALFFDYINYAFPDALNYYSSDPYQSGASYEMASFIIFGAATILLLRVIHHTIHKDPTRADIWVRRWALYLTLRELTFSRTASLLGARPQDSYERADSGAALTRDSQERSAAQAASTCRRWV